MSHLSKQGKRGSNNNRRGKKRCDRGADCPWKDEYQHNLEFSHGDEPTASSSQSKIDSQAFKGKGNRIKSSSASSNPYESSRCKVGQAAEKRSTASAISATIPSMSTNKKRTIAQNGANLVDLISPSPPRKKKPRPSTKSQSAKHVVDLCESDSEVEIVEESSKRPKPHKRAERQKIGGRAAAAKRMNGLKVTKSSSDSSTIIGKIQETHVFEPTENISRRSVEVEDQRQLSRALAESNRAVLREQDSEYEESLRQDEIKEREKREEDELQTAIEASERLHKEETQRIEEMKLQTAIQQLEMEPPEGSADVATIAFKLPSRCQKSRITRRFSANARCEQMIFFLSSCHDLDNVENWKLVEVVGGEEVPLNRTLEELSLTPRGLLIVKDLDR